MNWSDERYVRLFTRDTVTWLSWSFETRAVLCLLLRKVDRAGVLETGRLDKAQALALTLMAPLETCSKALEELTNCGTVVAGASSLVIPNFIPAQEARISDAQRQRDARERRAAEKIGATDGNQEEASHTPSHAVTASHTASHLVTPAVPSRAVPSRASQLHVEQARPVTALEDNLTADERDVWKCWQVELHHPKAVLTRDRLKLIRKWLPAYGVERLQAAILGCKRSPHHMGQNDRHQVYDSLELILRDAKHIEEFEAKSRGAA